MIFKTVKWLQPKFYFYTLEELQYLLDCSTGSLVQYWQKEESAFYYS